MHIAKVVLESASPYSQSRPHNTEALNKEAPAAFELRTWREKAHANENGEIFIPPMALKINLEEAAKYLGMKIKGKGKSTYTKHFESGIMVTDGPTLVSKSGQKYLKSECKSNQLFLNADGKRGPGTRVWRTFPIFHDWIVEVEYHILDDTITEDVFIEHLKCAGQFIGIGQFRPRNRGYFGRYNVVNCVWN